jgi:integrase
VDEDRNLWLGKQKGDLLREGAEMLYRHLKCQVKGMCNEKGPRKTCSKCGEKPSEGIYWYRFMVHGRIFHGSTRSTNRTRAADVERKELVEAKEDPHRKKKRARAMAFQKASQGWLALQEGVVTANTISVAKTSIKHLLKPLGAWLLCDITAADIAGYQQQRLREGAQGKTINIEIGVLRQIMKHHDLWAPLAGKVKSLRTRPNVGRALTPEEESLLLAECAKAESSCYAATVLALNTAMRRDEVRQLKWMQVDLFERKLTVGKSKTPDGTGRMIPLNQSAIKALADWGDRFPNRQAEHFIFPWCENKQIDPLRHTQGWRTAWRTSTRSIRCPKCGRRQSPADTCRKCAADIRGLKNPLATLRFHDLRHTCITKLAEGQASEGTIMAISGHISRRMLEHYSHIRVAAKRAALDAISTPEPKPLTGQEGTEFQTDCNQHCNQPSIAGDGDDAKILN